MAYIVTANTGGKINLAPKTREEEILQNVRFLLSTPKFTVPLDRDFGLSQRFIDKPLPVAESLFRAEILDAIEKYEPRVEVENVTFEQGDTPGMLIPQVEVNIVDGNE